MASVSQLKMFPSSSISNAQQCLAVCHFIRKDQQCRCRERLHRGRLLRIDLRLSTTGAQCSFVNTVQHEQALQFKPSKSAVMKTGQEKWLTDDSDCRIFRSGRTLFCLPEAAACGRCLLDIPSEAEHSQQRDAVPVWIELVPGKAVTG